jgi:hypothetical protein
MKDLSRKADAIAAQWGPGWGGDWQALRDFVDAETGGGLDCFALDLLTDAVASRLKTKEASR